MIASLKTTGATQGSEHRDSHSPCRLLYKPGPGEVSNLNLTTPRGNSPTAPTVLSDAATACATR